MQKASVIPEGSNLRESADFKAIVDAWADGLFDKAQATQDVTEKRALLDRIARATSVDQARRKRAADEFDALQRPAVNVADLPSDSAKPPTPAPSATAPVPTAQHTASTPIAVAAEPPPHKDPAPKPAPKPVAATAKPSAPQVSKKDKASSTLVRDNPFE